MDTVATIRDEAHEVGRGWSGPDAEPGWALVGALFDALAADADLLALAAEIPLDRLPGACCSWPASSGSSSSTPPNRGPLLPGPVAADRSTHFAVALHHFARTHADDLRAWFGHRYQMNEVGRCAQTALALGVVQRMAPGRRVGLVDVGTGSGIGLCLDRYHVDLGDGRLLGPSVHRCACAPPSTAPRHCPRSRRSSPPASASTSAPIDLDDPAACAWLTACTPPTSDAEARLAAAVDVARAAGLAIWTGDGVHRLAAAIDTLATGHDDALVVVLDSYTAVFLDDAGRARHASHRRWRGARRRLDLARPARPARH